MATKAKGNVEWKLEVPPQGLRPSQCRRWLRKTLAANLPEMTRRFMGDASSASCTHMRIVTELMDDPGKRSNGEGTLEKMMRELEAE